METAPVRSVTSPLPDLQMMPKSHMYEITQARPNEEEEEEEEDAFVRPFFSGRSTLFVGRGRECVHG